MMTQEQNELGRWAVLEVLRTCFPVPRLASGIKRQVEREVPFVVDGAAVDGWLEFERLAGNAAFTPDPQGSSKWWSITAAGMLALERR